MSLPFIIRRMGLSFQYSLPSRRCTPGSFLISSSRRAPSFSLNASGLNTMVSPRMVMRGTFAFTSTSCSMSAVGCSLMVPRSVVSFTSDPYA